MKRLLLSLAAVGLVASVAYAANITLSTVKGPTETGEWSLHNQEILDMARFKPGFCAPTSVAVSGAAAAVTCNNASGIIKTTATTAGASGTSPTVITVTDSKVFTGDGIICDVDQNGATSGSVLTCSPHITANGTFTLTLYDASSTALTSSTVTTHFLILTQGNPN